MQNPFCGTWEVELAAPRFCVRFTSSWWNIQISMNGQVGFDGSSMIGFDGWLSLRFSVANALGCGSSVVGCDLPWYFAIGFQPWQIEAYHNAGCGDLCSSHGNLRFGGRCSKGTGMSFLSLRSELAHHMGGPKLNRWFCKRAVYILLQFVYILCGEKSPKQKTYIHIYIFACTLGDLFLCMSWVRSLLIKLELRDGLRWCCWSWCVLGPNQFLHPSTRWEDGPMESLGLYR